VHFFGGVKFHHDFWAHKDLESKQAYEHLDTFNKFCTHELFCVEYGKRESVMLIDMKLSAYIVA